MSLMENLLMAVGSLQAHKLRSLLTMLGIIIGVGAVIIVVAIGQGGEAMLKSQIAGSGNTIELFYQPSNEEIAANPNIYNQAPFSQEDIRLVETIPGVKQVVATSSAFSTVRFREKTSDSSAIGINQAYLDVNDIEIAKGRGFAASDFISGRRVTMISSFMQEELFEGKSPIGEIIRIGAQPVEIIGVLKKPTGLLAFGSVEAYLPYNTWKTIFAKNEITQITLQAESADQIKRIGQTAAKKVNLLHGTEDSYQVINMEEIAQGLGQITKIMTLIIGSIAGISLFVGGIGVMNIMLVSVTERTREIGIRMALGATRKQVLTQFLIESMTLTLIGGIVGIVIGWGTSALISFFAGWPSLISWQVVAGGVLFSMIIGIVFGLLPANKAAKLNPIESLRYE
ncbi:ABC transporter permease [Peribacillus psychrosaccharolyticus]|uniref:ABC transporter permease n=1 Tax=Peribacillus psychrosaccharolyticus TaxID=1407 RepID=A0A974NNR6_PERPY|nr:ABC transporter permease [Peribacillus psychrosaccharolyticus]MEC2057257.1 ABC transporter permease [Peribacillus psychrosaccharolyticus]MED3742914.1 ABC transporter permease [Peribacillus psychrosaccharolyticus]QQT01020.1 ABC transporter permease [Peribacillus psychrosaccharolyticus]